MKTKLITWLNLKKPKNPLGMFPISIKAQILSHLNQNVMTKSLHFQATCGMGGVVVRDLQLRVAGETKQ